MGDDPVQNRLPGIQFIQRFGELAMGGNPHVLAPFTHHLNNRGRGPGSRDAAPGYPRWRGSAGHFTAR